MNNQDYKALHYIDKILNTGDIYEYGLLSYNRELNILPLTKQENEKAVCRSVTHAPKYRARG